MFGKNKEDRYRKNEASYVDEPAFKDHDGGAEVVAEEDDQVRGRSFAGRSWPMRMIGSGKIFFARTAWVYSNPQAEKNSFSTQFIAVL